jgi:hypothetical protein
MMSFVASKTYFLFQGGKQKRDEKKRVGGGQKVGTHAACTKLEAFTRCVHRIRSVHKKKVKRSQEKIPVRLRRRDRPREWRLELNSLCGSESLMEIEMADRMSCAGPV